MKLQGKKVLGFVRAHSTSHTSEQAFDEPDLDDELNYQGVSHIRGCGCWKEVVYTKVVVKVL